MKRNQWPNPLLFDPRHIEFDRGWEFIMKGIRKLKKMIEEGSEPRFTAEEYITMYTVVYNMCVHRRGYSQQLYEKYKETCEDFYRVTSEDYNALTYQPDDFILRDLVKRWGRHKVIVRVLPGIFQYLDRYFIPSKSLPRLNEVVGVNSFCESVYRKVSSKARDAIIRLIDKERKGEKIDKELVKNVINVFVGVGMGQVDAYEKDFEAVMLKATGEYYSSIASSWILEDYSDTEYVSKAEECLQIERDRASYYLHSSSEQKLLQKVQHVLFEPLCNKFKLKVITEGATLVQVAAKNKASSDRAGLLEQVLVRNLIKLHEDHTAYVDHCFKNYPQFRKALREAFEVFCNKAVGDSSTAEILAAFCDNLLKRGDNLMSDQEIQETLEKLVKKLLPCLSDKDLFAKFYRKRLACRLLFDRCLSKDHEDNILATMKQQCGAPFTSKMEGMITDVTLARDNQTSFQEYLQSNPSVNHPGMDLTATILTTGFWPSYKSLEVNLPAEMVKCMEVYMGFYETKTRNRKLTWIYSLGSCNIVGNFEPKKIELVVSTCQAALLLLFNTADRLSYSEIATQSNLNHDDLVRILRSLSCAQYNILIKWPNTNSILPNDNFEFNSKFSHRMRRIKIPLPPVVDERKEVLHDVGKDRRYAIDAAIVRIMKSQKILNYQQLVAYCVEQLRHIFKPDIRAIKKRIEDLISRDYLERDKENLNLLKYLV